jgi:hypothetical protein
VPYQILLIPEILFGGGGVIWFLFYMKRDSYIPQSLFGGCMQILSKINFRNLKKIYISCKSTFFPFDPFSYKIKTKSPPHPQKKFPVLIKFDTAHIFIPPAIQREGVYHPPNKDWGI